uniref:Uncharacterized protein n=1 Tax=Chelydra serpentina TaxID=8475 RepID=A0A8C3RRZ0_CHESE
MFQCCLRVHLGIFPHEATPLKTRKKNLSSYSPTTGTRQISAFSSPTSHNVQKLGNGLSNVENSLVRFLKMRQRLTSLQALEGSRELENIFGVSDSSCNLKAEVQKTKVLSKLQQFLSLYYNLTSKLIRFYSKYPTMCAVFIILLKNPSAWRGGREEDEVSCL